MHNGLHPEDIQAVVSITLINVASGHREHLMLGKIAGYEYDANHDGKTLDVLFVGSCESVQIRLDKHHIEVSRQF